MKKISKKEIEVEVMEFYTDIPFSFKIINKKMMKKILKIFLAQVCKNK